MDEERKITREAKSTDAISAKYDIGDKEVPFPLGFFIVCILVDVIDIILTITAVGILPWWVFTMFIFTPILLMYINSKDKKFSVKGIQTSLETRGTISAAKEVGKLTRETKALKAAGEATKALEKAADLAKAIQKLPPWLRSVFVFMENIPLIEFLPMNSIMLYMAFSDNKSSIEQAKKAMESMSKNLDFKINKAVIRPKGGVVSK